MSSKDKPVLCSVCGEKAPRLMPKGVEGVFASKTSGPGLQNTGISGIDHKADRVIGRSAEKGWAFQDRRAGVKRGVLRDNPGATSQDLTELPDGTWDLMDSQVRNQQAAGRIIHNAAMRAGAGANHDTYHLDNPGDTQAMGGQNRRGRKRSLPSGPQK